MSRALPDVRDGLKPVHRRILYAMNELGLVPGRPYKKIGDRWSAMSCGKYHPHGDSSVYDALVRMVQDFSLRYPLIDGQGNFGTVDGDPAAAYRYTEARLTYVAMAMLEDIDKNTVPISSSTSTIVFAEPTVLPVQDPQPAGRTGRAGIAVGMATNIPPAQPARSRQAVEVLIDDPEATISELREAIKGPDFPTAGYIYGRDGIKECLRDGTGRIIMRSPRPDRGAGVERQVADRGHGDPLPGEQGEPGEGRSRELAHGKEDSRGSRPCATNRSQRGRHAGRDRAQARLHSQCAS